MDKNEIERKLKRYVSLVREEYSPKKIVLYGSYVRGNFTENSDIDVAVIVEEIKGDFPNSDCFINHLIVSAKNQEGIEQLFEKLQKITLTLENNE